MLNAHHAKPRFKIAHIMPWSSVGGTEHATLRIAEGVAPHGFASVIFCREEATEVREFFAAHDLPVNDYRAIEPSLHRPQKFLRAARELAQKFRAERVDLVHCADILAAHYTSLAGRLARVPVVCQVRNRHAEISLRDRSFLLPVNKWVFVSRDTWRHFGMKVSTKRGTVVYDGIRIEPFIDDNTVAEGVRHEFGISADAPIVGTLARVAPQKDFPTLAHAARQVIAKHPATRFLIVGDNAQTETHRQHYEEIKRLLHELGIATNFIFTGFRTYTRRLLQAMDIFVLCTHFEGLPLVLLEAMAQRKAVVATNVDGIPEVIEPERIGLLHAHEDAEELARHITRLIEDEHARRTLGLQAQEHVAANFSQEQFAANMKNVYEDVLRDARRTMPEQTRIREEQASEGA